MQANIRGRFAPTPSGRMHAGNVFAALMAWLDVRSCGGSLVLRIEDLDPRAQNPEATRLLLDDLRWLGLDWDEGPYYQSERADVYKQALQELQDQGLTYPCFCTRSELHAATAPHASDGTYIYVGTCRNLSSEEVTYRRTKREPATRLRVPDKCNPAGTLSFTDLVWGPQTEVLACECGDFLVQRSDRVVAYQLAVVVDDALMGVNHVVRGRDLLGSCARQMYLQNLLGYDHPTYAHVPLLVDSTGRRLSKRDRDLDLGELRSELDGPEKLLGMLASCVGLAEKGEAASAQVLAERFSWEAIRSYARQGDVIVKEE
ncbi:MAG: tRNA glutamyl-Q(34) synthetase GluQRS [Coriobacteriales bacterium]|nr:tRNA glutamyl-Q(34) synthetase GluQRS [Coriobacteriales bacterium]